MYLVGSDSDITDNLTYTIVSISTHGTLKDPLNGNAILVAGSTLSSNGNVVTFVPGSSKYSSYIESGTTSFTYKVNDGHEKQIRAERSTEFRAEIRAQIGAQTKEAPPPRV